MAVIPRPSDTDELIQSASLGDASARQQLLIRHHDRLRRMVTVRIDSRLAARVDPSDIVQEALADATRHLDSYLRDRPLPFYVWLRRLAWERIIHANRRHIAAQRRSVNREDRELLPLPDQSAAALADRLVAHGSGPLSRLINDERRQQVLNALSEMPEASREILVLRYLEGLSTDEIAAVLGISTGAVMTRHTRALQRLRTVLDADASENEQ